MCIYREKTWSLQFSKLSYSGPSIVDVSMSGANMCGWHK